MKTGVLERYKNYLPITVKTPLFSLGEGDTPLVKSNQLVKEIGCEELYFKLEGCNPTGSFKDRGMTMAISKAVEAGSKAVMCASTGNTSASAAAYACRCGLKCFVLIPEGKIAKGKLLQAYRYGAKVIMVEGNFDEALEIVKEMTADGKITLVNSINPFRIEGQKTGAFEVVDDLGDAPEYHAIPVGNAGNITAYWKGYKEYKKAGKSEKLPKMLGFQAAGSAPIVLGKRIEKPETLATAIRIGNPASWKGATDARDESGGLIDAVTDEEITRAYRFIAEREGVFAEPASAAGVAGVINLAKKNFFKEGTRIVITLTGSGLKDPDFALSFEDPIYKVKSTVKAVKEVIAS